MGYYYRSKIHFIYGNQQVSVHKGAWIPVYCSRGRKYIDNTPWLAVLPLSKYTKYTGNTYLKELLCKRCLAKVTPMSLLAALDI